VIRVPLSFLEARIKPLSTRLGFTDATSNRSGCCANTPAAINSAICNLQCIMNGQSTRAFYSSAPARFGSCSTVAEIEIITYNKAEPCPKH